MFLNIEKLLKENLKKLSFIVNGQLWTGSSLTAFKSLGRCLLDHGITDGCVISVIKQIGYRVIEVVDVLTLMSFKMRVPENIPCGITVREEVERRWGILSTDQSLYIDMHCHCEFGNEDRLIDFFMSRNISLKDFGKMCRCGACQREWFAFGWICPAMFFA